MFDKNTYLNRRNCLRQKLKNNTTQKDGIVLILGNSDSPANYAGNCYKFRQDSNFLYFFGIDLPGFAGIIDLDNDQDYLFGNDAEIEDIIWTGPQTTVEEYANKIGIKKTATLRQLPEFIKKFQQQERPIHFSPPYRTNNMLWLENLLGIPALQTPKHASIPLIKAIISLRSIKEPQEIVEIDKACDITYKMHEEATRMAQAGVYEYDIAGRIEGIALAANCVLSYTTILSKHGEILHNHHYNNRLSTGDLLLIDAACESPMHYASDVTRTIPVGGKLSVKQREIYDIVLRANNNTFKISAPGIKQLDVHLQAAKIIASGLKDLKLLRGNLDDIVGEGVHALFFPHGLGHMLGLDAHDMEDLGENYVGYDEEIKRSEQFGLAYLRIAKRLEVGYTLTNEPGIYFIPELIDLWQSENKFAEFINYDKLNEYRDFGGIRIEDDILITENGCRLLGTKRVPV